jgi:hypothetical protein
MDAIASFYDVARATLYVWEDMMPDGTSPYVKAVQEKKAAEQAEFERLEKERLESRNMDDGENESGPAPGVTDAQEDIEEVLNGT